jgi:hypothetical protein
VESEGKERAKRAVLLLTAGCEARLFTHDYLSANVDKFIL